MKAKDMLDDKLIKILSSNSKSKDKNNPIQEVLAPFEALDEEEISESDDTLTKLLYLGFMLEYLEFKDKKFYDSLEKNFKENKREADINIYELEKKFPVIKKLNEAFSVYKTNTYKKG